MINKEWEKRLGFCKRCGRFGRVHGGSGERGYSLCASCLEEFFQESVRKFLKASGGRTFLNLSGLDPKGDKDEN